MAKTNPLIGAKGEAADAAFGREVRRRFEEFEEYKRQSAERERAERKPKGVRLSEAQVTQLGRDLGDVAMILGAIKRLSMEIGADSDMEDAASTAIECMAKIGSGKADYVCGQLGQMRYGGFSEELERLACIAPSRFRVSEPAQGAK